MTIRSRYVDNLSIIYEISILNKKTLLQHICRQN